MGGSITRRALHVSIAFAALFAVIPRAHADEKTVSRGAVALTLTRGEGAEQCPDASELERLAHVSHGLSAEPPKHAYRVSIERTRGAYRAEIADETANRARRLVDAAPRCSPLGEAIAVVLATMWSSEQTAEPPITEPIAPPSVVPPAPPAPVDVGPPASPRIRVVNDIGGGIAIGLVSPIAPLLGAHIGLERAPYSIAFGLMGTSFAGLDLPPGEVRAALFTMTLRACLWSGDTTRIGLCPRVFVGAVSAHSVGYDVDGGHTRPWYAAGLELFVAGSSPLDWLHYRASATAIAPVHAETFSIAGIGSAYETPPIGGMVTLSFELGRHSSRSGK